MGDSRGYRRQASSMRVRCRFGICLLGHPTTSSSSVPSHCLLLSYSLTLLLSYSLTLLLSLVPPSSFLLLPSSFLIHYSLHTPSPFLFLLSSIIFTPSSFLILPSSFLFHTRFFTPPSFLSPLIRTPRPSHFLFPPSSSPFP